MMIDDSVMPMIENIMDTLPEDEWIDAIKKALPAEKEVDIIEMVMFLNVGDCIDLMDEPEMFGS